MRDTINDSPSIRWWLFSSFGASHVCPEMLMRGAPLVLEGDPASVGRFFPTSCQTQLDDARRTMLLSFGGSGYAWTPIAGRVAFEASVSVNYRPDFALGEDALYVWAKPEQIVSGPNFVVLSIENPVVNWAAQGPPGYLATTFGQQLIASKISQGFTVVRTESGDDFSLGILSPPQKPQRPFATSEQNLVLLNETVRVRPGQVEFMGPLVVSEKQQVLSVRTRSNGPAAELFLMHRTVADDWRRGLDRGVPLAPPLGPILSSVAIPAGDQQRAWPMAPGQYMLVLDHSAKVGQVAPPWNLLDNVAGMASAGLGVSLVVELLEQN